MESIRSALHWLRVQWWGLIVTYVIVFIAVYTVLWAIAEPLSLFEGQSNTVFPLTVLFLTSHATLFLDLYSRKRSQFKLSNAVNQIVLGAWRGNYSHKNKQRSVEMRFIQSTNGNLTAEIHTSTQEGKVIQRANNVAIGATTFKLETEEITTSRERNSKWRPEVWLCTFDSDQGTTMNVTITDMSSNGVERTIAQTQLKQI